MGTRAGWGEGRPGGWGPGVRTGTDTHHKSDRGAMVLTTGPQLPEVRVGDTQVTPQLGNMVSQWPGFPPFRWHSDSHHGLHDNSLFPPQSDAATLPHSPQESHTVAAATTSPPPTCTNSHHTHPVTMPQGLLNVGPAPDLIHIAWATVNIPSPGIVGEDKDPEP